MTGWVLISIMIIMTDINFITIAAYSISMRIVKYRKDKKKRLRRRQIEAQIDPLFRSNYESENVSNTDQMQMSTHNEMKKQDRITFSHLRRF